MSIFRAYLNFPPFSSSTGALHPGRHADRQLRAGGHGLQAETQRPARKYRSQVIKLLVLFWRANTNSSQVHN